MRRTASKRCIVMRGCWCHLPTRQSRDMFWQQAVWREVRIRDRQRVTVRCVNAACPPTQWCHDSLWHPLMYSKFGALWAHVLLELNSSNSDLEGRGPRQFAAGRGPPPPRRCGAAAVRRGGGAGVLAVRERRACGSEHCLTGLSILIGQRQLGCGGTVGGVHGGSGALACPVRIAMRGWCLLTRRAAVRLLRAF